MRIMDPDAGWDWMVRKTRRYPLLGSDGVSLISRPEAVTLVSSRRVKAFGTTATLAVACLLGAGAGWEAVRTREWGLLLIVGFAALLILVCAVSWCDRTKLRLDRLSSRVLIARTSVLPTTEVELDGRGLSAELAIAQESSLVSPSGPGWCDLRLLCEGRQGAVRLAASLSETNMRAAYEQLCRSLGRSGQDRTSVQVALRDGRMLEVSRTPIARTAAGFRTHRLLFPRPGLAVLAPSRGQRVFFGGLALAGAGALVAAFSGGGVEWPWLLLPLTAGGVFLLVGIPGACGVFGPAPVAADLARRSVTVGRGKRRRSIPLSDVAGLQVCSHEQPGDSDSAPYTAYSLNLALAEPPGERINLACNANRNSILRDGARLAEFMGVPLWDHTTVG